MASAVDRTAPDLRITLPTTVSTYETNQPLLTLGGTAMDDDGVASVAWSNARGFSGTASGTETWIAGVRLLEGSNTVASTARDSAGNAATKTIVINVLKGSRTPRTRRGSVHNADSD